MKHIGSKKPRVPQRKKKERTLTYIIQNFKKIRGKAYTEKKSITYKGTRIIPTSDFSTATLEAKRQ